MELRQPLFAWLKLKNAVDLAEEAVKVSAAGLEGARRRIRAETAESYVTSLEALRFYTGLPEGPETVLPGGPVEPKTGSGAASDSGRATTALKLSTAFPAGEPVFEEERLRAQSLERSPIVRKLRLQMEQARKNAARLRGRSILKPDIALSIALEITGQKVPWTEEGWEDYWNSNITVRLGAEGSLFDSGRSHWQIAQGEESVKSAEEALGLAVRQLELSLRRAVQEARVAQARIRAAESELRARAEGEKNAREAFGQELVTRQKLGLARLDRLAAEVELLRARCDLAIALVHLEYLSGQSPE